MRISAELRDHDAAGSLAEELPYWGWLEDGRTCLTRSGELIAAGRIGAAVPVALTAQCGCSVQVVSVVRTLEALGRAQAILRGWTEASGPAEPDAEIREQIARIEPAILQGEVQTLDEFGGLQGAIPMTGPRVMPPLGCENDTGGRFTVWPSCDSQRNDRVSEDAAASYASAPRPDVAGRAATAVMGATPPADALVVAWDRACFHTLRPRRGRSRPWIPADCVGE